MYHSRKLPVLIQRPLRLSKGKNGRAVDSADAKHGRLYISTPDNPARHTQLDKHLLTIGRSRRNDIVLSDEQIASHHARLRQTADGWQIEDLGSDSGTTLNGEALTPNSPQSWSPNQPLKIAGYTLRWVQPANGGAALLGGAAQVAQSPPTAGEDDRVSILDRSWPVFTIALILIWLMVSLGVPVLLPLFLASVLTFVGVFIAPGFLLADMIGWRLGLDKMEHLALSLPAGIVVLAVPGMTALLLHWSLTALAFGWFATSAVVVLVWMFGRSKVGFFGRLFKESDSMPVRPSKSWAIDEVLLLVFLVGLFVFIFPALSLYKN